jgi:hypothetical protein
MINSPFDHIIVEVTERLFHTVAHTFRDLHQWQLKGHSAKQPAAALAVIVEKVLSESALLCVSVVNRKY